MSLTDAGWTGGVRKKKGSSYSCSLKRLQQTIEGKLDLLTSLEQQRESLVGRESVLVDLVVQQDNHITHLYALAEARVQAAQQLDLLLTQLGQRQGADAPASDDAQRPPPPPPLAPEPRAASTAGAAPGPGPQPGGPPGCTTPRGVDAVTAPPPTQCSTPGGLSPHPQQQLGSEWPPASDHLHHRPSHNSPAGHGPLPAGGAGAAPAAAAAAAAPPRCASGSEACATSCSSSGGGGGGGGGAAATAAAATEAAAAHSGGSQQYCHQLLINATAEQWERAMTMGVQDWAEYFTNLVRRLCLIMELIGRLDEGEGQRLADGLDDDGTEQGQQRHPGPAGGAGDGEGGEGDSSSEVVCPRALVRDLNDVVDDFVVLVNISVIFNPMAVREMTVRNLLTMERVVDVPVSHWQQVNRQMRLTDEQSTTVRHGYEQFWRILGQVQATQQAITSSVAWLTLAEGGGARRGGAGAEAEGLAAAAGGGDAAAAATAALRERELLERRLSEHMVRWTVAAGLLLQHYINTLTRLQIAQLLVSTYPFFPRMAPLITALMAPGGQLHQADSQQASALRSAQLQQLRRRHTQLTVQHKAFLRRRQELLQQLGLDDTPSGGGGVGGGAVCGGGRFSLALAGDDNA